MTTRYVPVSDEDTTSLLGEGIHTGLRKGTDAPGAHETWMAINTNDEAWSEALDWAVWGLHEMGFVLCKVEEQQ